MVEDLARHRVRLGRGDAVGELGRGLRGVVGLGPARAPSLEGTAERVVLHVAALAVGVDCRGRQCAPGVGGHLGGVVEVVRGDRFRRCLAGGGGVADGGLRSGRIGHLGLTAVGVVRGFGDGDEAGAGAVVLVLAGHVTLGRDGVQGGGVVVVGASGVDEVSGQARCRSAGLGHRLGFGDGREEVLVEVAVVRRGGALLIARLGCVPGLGFGLDHAVGIELPDGLRASQATTCDRFPALVLLRAGLVGVHRREAVCRAGVA